MNRRPAPLGVASAPVVEKVTGHDVHLGSCLAANKPQRAAAGGQGDSNHRTLARADLQSTRLAFRQIPSTS
jgi:hypothetical protein